MSESEIHPPSLADETTIEAAEMITRLISLLPKNETARRVAEEAKDVSQRLLDAQALCANYWQEHHFAALMRQHDGTKNRVEDLRHGLHDALNDLAEHTSRSLGMKKLLEGMLFWQTSERCGTVLSEDETSGVVLLLDAHQNRLQQLFDATWEAWARTKHRSRPFLADDPAYGALLVVCDLLNKPGEIHWPANHSERQSLLKLCQGRIDDMRAADSQPVQ